MPTHIQGLHTATVWSCMRPWVVPTLTDLHVCASLRRTPPFPRAGAPPSVSRAPGRRPPIPPAVPCRVGARTYHQSSLSPHSVTYVFQAAAYGVPKYRSPRQAEKNKQADKGAGGRLMGLARFLMGSESAPEPPPKPEPEPEDEHHGLPSSLSYLHGPGLRSAIRDEGRIVKTRLRSLQVGEDAYFLKDDAMGIADGVGGWASSSHGDPALFSRLLMHFCYAELQKYDEAMQRTHDADSDSDSDDDTIDLVEILQVAWERCVRASKREGILGSSTAMLARLCGDELHMVNMGDCGLVLIRDGEVLFRSAEQQHSFNFPVQLGMMDATVESVTLASALCQHRDGVIPDGALDDELPDMNERLSDYIHSYDDNPDARHFDTPRHDAGYVAMQVQPGDMVIMASDGFFDNVFDDVMIDAVRETLDRHAQGEISRDDLPQAVSETLCGLARDTMSDPRAIASPFQEHANEEGIYYVGGKNDDVTVLTALVCAPDALPSPAPAWGIATHGMPHPPST